MSEIMSRKKNAHLGFFSRPCHKSKLTYIRRINIIVRAWPDGEASRRSRVRQL